VQFLRKSFACELAELYASEHLGMMAIAERLSRSGATVKTHIDRHSKAVERSGFCPDCRRVHGQNESAPAERTK